MASVTINTTPPIQPPQRHVVGDLVVKIFNISGSSGNTLDTKMANILFVDYQRTTSAGSATAITAFTVSGGTITITSSGTMTNEVLIVYAKQG